MKNYIISLLLIYSFSYCQIKDSATMKVNKTNKSNSIIVNEPKIGTHKYIVDTYCIDFTPDTDNGCDQIGRIYSYVEINHTRSELTFFFIDLELNYKIVSIEADPDTKDLYYYMLCNPLGHRMYASCDKDRTFFLFRFPSTLVTCHIK